MTKLASKLNKLLHSLKLQHLPQYLLLATFCSNMALTSAPLAVAQDRNAEDLNLIALTDTQNPDSSQDETDTKTVEPAMFIEPTCAPGLNCPGDPLIKPAVSAVLVGSPVKTAPVQMTAGKIMTVVTTAYSSTPDQTDDSPYITANGTHVRDGIIACNFLPFGAKVKFPEYSGDKVYMVEDRMAAYNSHKMDIWMETREQAMQFGVKRLTVEVLE